MLKHLHRLIQAPQGLAIDFTRPRGAAALAPSEGVSWRIFSNPVSLFIGGVSAVLLELAEPSVRTGVWEHSSFRHDPFGRLHRTGYAAMVTVYAPAADARRMIARIVHIHEHVRGHTPDGLTYEANDPRLLTWVQATAIFGFAHAYHVYARPLSASKKDAAFLEGQASAQLYGATALPKSWTAWETLLAETIPTLEAHPILQEFVQLMENAEIFPRPLRWLQRLLVKAAIAMAPPAVQNLLALPWTPLSRWERVCVRSLVWCATALPLSQLPAAQARKRVR